jgi:HKD family nuclease
MQAQCNRSKAERINLRNATAIRLSHDVKKSPAGRIRSFTVPTEGAKHVCRCSERLIDRRHLDINEIRSQIPDPRSEYDNLTTKMPLLTSNLKDALEDQIKRYPNPKVVYVISSYIRKEGLRILKPFFEDLRKQGAQIAVITTLQRHITDYKALDYLSNLNGGRVLVFWPTQPNLHAKGWLFLYGPNTDTAHGNDTVIIGSSNITRNGIDVSVEWNVLLRRCDAGPTADEIIEGFKHTFEKYCYHPQYRAAMIPWPSFSLHPTNPIRNKLRQLLLTDEQVIELYGSPGLQTKWDDLHAEVESLREVSQKDLPQLVREAAGYDAEHGGPVRKLLDEMIDKLFGDIPIPTGIDTAVAEASTKEAEHVDKLSLEVAKPYYSHIGPGPLGDSPFW